MTKAPTFKLTTDTGDTVTLPDTGTVLVYFYPRANTPGCTTEACDFRDAAVENPVLEGVDIIGISPDSPEKLAKFRADHGLTFTLASDPDHAVAEAYGAWGEKKNYGKVTQGIIRSTFLIKDGAIVQEWKNVRAKGHVERVLKELER